MTNINHITCFTHGNTAYLHFYGCNFQCKGCIRNLSIYDIHLPNDARQHLERFTGVKLLKLCEVRSMLRSLNVRKIILGGGEPTLDPELVALLEALDVRAVLLTNGVLLDKEYVKKLEDIGLNEVWVSVKAYTKGLHEFYTRRSNKRVLNAINILNQTNIKLRVESVFIPGLIEGEEIGRIAKFIANVDPAIPYRIDGFIPVPKMPWGKPSRRELSEAVQVAKRHLKAVSSLHEETKPLGEIINVYPKPKVMSYSKLFFQ